MRKNSTLPLPVPTEAEEQIALFEWAALQSGRFPELALLYHVPNGGSRNKIEAARLRAQGVNPAFPIYAFPLRAVEITGFTLSLNDSAAEGSAKNRCAGSTGF